MHVYFGSYTKGPDAKGVGITHARFDGITGGLETVAEYKQAENPSWLHADRGGKRLFAASELDDASSDVHSYEIKGDGTLRHLSKQTSPSRSNCHLTTTGDRLFATSYGDGQLTGYPLRDGVIQPCDQLVVYKGSGPNTARQASAHAHQATVSPDGRWVYVCDLGSDRIHRHPAGTASKEAEAAIELPAGAGPRHMVFHRELPRLYVWCELQPLLLEVSWDSTTGDLCLEMIHNLNDLTNDARVGDGAAIHLHPSGRWLGVSERVASTVCLFSLAMDGSATWSGQGPTAGVAPRDFAFSPDGKWLLIAYQKSHRVAVYPLDNQCRIAGEPTSRMDIGSPVCICMTGDD